MGKEWEWSIWSSISIEKIIPATPIPDLKHQSVSSACRMVTDHRCVFFWLVVWLPFFYFPIYWVSNHPNWLSYFSEGWPNHQPGFFSKVFAVVLFLTTHNSGFYQLITSICLLKQRVFVYHPRVSGCSTSCCWVDFLRMGWSQREIQPLGESIGNMRFDMVWFVWLADVSVCEVVVIPQKR